MSYCIIIIHTVPPGCVPNTVPSNVWTNFPVAISNMLIIPSIAPQAINFPSGL